MDTIAQNEQTKSTTRQATKTLRATAAIAMFAATSVFGGSAAMASDTTTAKESKRQGGQPLFVGMGDSFMSGEGGRFAGNVYNSASSAGVADDGDHNWTWQAYKGIWGESVSDTSKGWRCHRSETSVVNTLKAKNPGSAAANLACSGAIADNILNNGQLGEPPQIARLKELAKDDKFEIRAVVVSIGGNDMKFGSVMADCTQIVRKIDCGTNGEIDVIKGTSANASKAITKSLDEITRVMRDAGYEDGTYNFVYQSAPNLFETSGERVRYDTPDNWFGNWYGESPGVPMSNGTVDWIKREGQPFMNSTMKGAVRTSINKQITFLDTTNAFWGHELSSRETLQIKKFETRWVGYPRANTAEWVVAINSNYIAGSIGNTNRQQESYHPNRFGQQALAACINKAIGGGPGVNVTVACVGSPGKGPDSVEAIRK